jgi:hypothetical protein
MQFLTQCQTVDLLRNGKSNLNGEQDFKPVVKLFTPWANATWLLSEINPNDPDIAFGLCDLGQGTPELGYVSLTELRGLRGPGGLTVERDLFFKADRTLQAYADEARSAGCIRA